MIWLWIAIGVVLFFTIAAFVLCQAAKLGDEQREHAFKSRGLP